MNFTHITKQIDLGFYPTYGTDAYSKKSLKSPKVSKKEENCTSVGKKILTEHPSYSHHLITKRISKFNSAHDLRAVTYTKKIDNYFPFPKMIVLYLKMPSPKSSNPFPFQDQAGCPKPPIPSSSHLFTHPKKNHSPSQPAKTHAAPLLDRLQISLKIIQDLKYLKVQQKKVLENIEQVFKLVYKINIDKVKNHQTHSQGASEAKKNIVTLLRSMQKLSQSIVDQERLNCIKTKGIYLEDKYIINIFPEKIWTQLQSLRKSFETHQFPSLLDQLNDINAHIKEKINAFAEVNKNPVEYLAFLHKREFITDELLKLLTPSEKNPIVEKKAPAKQQKKHFFSHVYQSLKTFFQQLCRFFIYIWKNLWH